MASRTERLTPPVLLFVGLACAGCPACDNLDAPDCAGEFFIPLVATETTESYFNATIAEFDLSSDEISIRIQFDASELDCSDPAECPSPGLIESRIPLVGSERGLLLAEGTAVRAGVFNDSDVQSRIEVLDPNTGEHLFDAGVLSPPQTWDTPRGTAFNDGVFLEHFFNADEGACRPVTGAPAHYAGVLVHADGGNQAVKHGDDGVHVSGGTSYVVGVPWSYTDESDCDGKCKGESFVYLWRADDDGS